MPCELSVSISASSPRCAKLYWFWTQTILAIFAAVDDLFRCRGAEADVADEALALKVGEDGERLLDRSLGRTVDVEHETQVHDVQHVHAEPSEVVVHGAGEILGRKGGVPGAVVASTRADLGDDGQIVRVRIQGFADDLIGDVRSIEVAGVDVIDTAGDRLPQHGDGGGAIFRWSKDAPSGELHGPVAETVDGAVAERVGSGGGDVGHERSSIILLR